MQYEFLSPPFVTQARFIEAVWLLWNWDEGERLLRDAAAYKVWILTGGVASPTAFAAYSPFYQNVYVSERFTEVSTWMLAQVLAHELQHASDDKAGRYIAKTMSNCILREQVAFRVEARFLTWVSQSLGLLPNPGQVAQRLSLDDWTLYWDTYNLIQGGNLDSNVRRRYEAKCSSSP